MRTLCGFWMSLIGFALLIVCAGCASDQTPQVGESIPIGQPPEVDESAPVGPVAEVDEPAPVDPVAVVDESATVDDPARIQESFLTALAGLWTEEHCVDDPVRVGCGLDYYAADGSHREIYEADDYYIDETQHWSATAITSTSGLVVVGRADRAAKAIAYITLDNDTMRINGSSTLHRIQPAGVVRSVPEVEPPDRTPFAGTWFRPDGAPASSAPDLLTLAADSTFTALFEETECRGYWSMSESGTGAAVRLLPASECDVAPAAYLTLHRRWDELFVNGLAYAEEPSSRLRYVTYNFVVGFDAPLRDGEESVMRFEYWATHPEATRFPRTVRINLGAGASATEIARLEGPFTPVEPTYFQIDMPFTLPPGSEGEIMLAAVDLEVLELSDGPTTTGLSIFIELDAAE